MNNKSNPYASSPFFSQMHSILPPLLRLAVPSLFRLSYQNSLFFASIQCVLHIRSILSLTLSSQSYLAMNIIMKLVRMSIYRTSSHFFLRFAIFLPTLFSITVCLSITSETRFNTQYGTTGEIIILLYRVCICKTAKRKI